MVAVTGNGKGLSTTDIVYIGIFAALIAVCSWIAIPTAVPFTMQTFAVFLAVLVLGGKRGTMAILVYLLLGAAGVPVFANFTGGMGVLLGSTGGYFIGFVLTGIVMWAFESAAMKKMAIRIFSMLLGLLSCYALGTVWFMRVYGQANGPVGLMTALSWCVFPFILPDLIKMALACAVSPTLRRVILNTTHGHA